MIILVLTMLTIGVLASLALGSACLIGQALVESQGCPDLAADEQLTSSVASWQSATVSGALKVAH